MTAVSSAAPTGRLLAIESATDWLSIALLDGEDVVLLREAEGTRKHASSLLPLIDTGLSEIGWSIGDLDSLAVSAGPGSFTSLRIGLATAKGLAFGRNLRAVGVSTLEAMASAAPIADSSAAVNVVALLDARRGQWYAGGWSRSASGSGAASSSTPRSAEAGAAGMGWTSVLAEGLYAPEQLAADVDGPVILVSPEPRDWWADFEAAGVRVASIVEGVAARPRADTVGRLGVARLAAGEGGSAEALGARYLRRAEAEAKRLGGPVEEGEVARIDPSPR
jgi:tRNA threonylcarbamoyladenosine biosynthesis protein TsaB